MKKLKVGKKSRLKYFGVQDIRDWEPCYDPSRYLKEDWRGTAIDILNIEAIPFADRLWCVLRKDLVSERVMRLFAVWCYRDTLNWVKNPDPRSIEAANVAERFANGQATREELLVAEWAARGAAWSAEDLAARSAARGAAWSAADSAAWSAADLAEDLAARSAARVAAAWSAQERQKQKLIEMIKAEVRERIKK